MNSTADRMMRVNPFDPVVARIVDTCQSIISPQVKADGGIDELTKETEKIIELSRASGDRSRSVYILATAFRYALVDLLNLDKPITKNVEGQ